MVDKRLEAAVFVSGTVSMGLELLAGRIMAPELGSNIYVWGEHDRSSSEPPMSRIAFRAIIAPYVPARSP